MRPPSINRYKHHLFPAGIIRHAVWLSFPCCLRYRDVEARQFARGVTVSYEAIRKWCRACGQHDANQRRHICPGPGGTWHLDEVFLTITGERQYQGRAVDQDGNILDILVQRRRDKTATKMFSRMPLKGLTRVPRVMVTDQLKSDSAAIQAVLPGVEHWQHCSVNNRAEHSHQPTRQRERRMQGCISPSQTQRFLSTFGPIIPCFRPRRHLLPAPAYRQEVWQRFHTWQHITSLPTAA
jgi:putative transposase